MWEMLTGIVRDFWMVLGEMSPYLLFGFLVAGLLAVIIPTEMVERHLGGGGLMPVLKASLFGVPLPLCSCGVIPVAASLSRSGAGRGATAAFLISTPQTGVDSIMVTLSLLGPVYAVFRPVAAFVNGVIGGALVSWLGDRAERPVPAGAKLETERCCTDETCARHSEHEGWFTRMLRHGFVTLPKDIGKALLVGLVVSALISALVPDDFFAGNLGHGPLAYIVMMFVGIPVYVCATASVPIAATLVVMKGLSPGAAFVFLMTGPATNAAGFATVWKIMGKRTAIVYLASIAVTALVSGVALDWIYEATGAQPRMLMEHVHGSAAYGYLKTASAVALLGVLGAAFFRRTTAAARTCVEEETETITMDIQGMTCSHCAASVTKALRGLKGVASVEVDLESGKAAVAGSGLDERMMAKTVEELGYTVTGTRAGGDLPKKKTNP